MGRGAAVTGRNSRGVTGTGIQQFHPSWEGEERENFTKEQSHKARKRLKIPPHYGVMRGVGGAAGGVWLLWRWSAVGWDAVRKSDANAPVSPRFRMVG